MCNGMIRLIDKDDRFQAERNAGSGFHTLNLVLACDQGISAAIPEDVADLTCLQLDIDGYEHAIRPARGIDRRTFLKTLGKQDPNPRPALHARSNKASSHRFHLLPERRIGQAARTIDDGGLAAQ